MPDTVSKRSRLRRDFWSRSIPNFSGFITTAPSKATRWPATSTYAQFVERLISLVAALIRRGVREGCFRRVDASLAAHAYTGMLRSYCLTRELFPGHALARSDREVARLFCDIFLRGISAGGHRQTRRRAHGFLWSMTRSRPDKGDAAP